MYGDKVLLKIFYRNHYIQSKAFEQFLFFLIKAVYIIVIKRQSNCIFNLFQCKKKRKKKRAFNLPRGLS